jgi:uncharacterized protein YabE (DUF348 family)
VLIVNDHRSASIFTGALTIAIALFSAPHAAYADSAAAASAPAPAPDSASAPVPADQPVDVTVVANAETTTASTHASDVGAFLAEHKMPVSKGDFVSVPLDTPICDGMKIVYRRAVMVTIFVGGNKRIVRSAAPTVGALLAEQRIPISSSDEVTPSLRVVPLAHDVVHVIRVDAWTVREKLSIAPATRERDAADLAAGTTRTVDPGRAGLREATIRFVRRDGSRTTRTVLASRIIRAPRPRILERGIAEYQSLAHVAEQGFTNAMHLAGSAIQMIATAYTAGCYGCTGITATGVRAGFGVIAVDPRVIPLGTRLYIPGYGRAIAGDTGGSIHGHRVDLGMNTLAQALRFGRRAVTVYVLR